MGLPDDLWRYDLSCFAMLVMVSPDRHILSDVTIGRPLRWASGGLFASFSVAS